MAGRSRRTGIRRAVEQRLVPEFLARGFTHEAETPDPNLTPFGRFLRRSERGGLDVVVVHFNKNRTSHFHFLVTRSAQPDESAGALPWSLRPDFVVWRRGLIYRRWFGVSKYAREGIEDREYDDAAQVAVRHLAVVEQVLATGRPSLYVEKFPWGGLRDNGLYWALCILSVLLPFFAALWLLGWIWRHL